MNPSFSFVCDQYYKEIQKLHWKQHNNMSFIMANIFVVDRQPSIEKYLNMG